MSELDVAAAGRASVPAWGDLIGMDEPLAAWRRLVAADRLPSVMLVTGRPGIGKRMLLAALAAMHVCETGVACGACRQCVWLISGEHPEVLWLESEDGRLLLEQAKALQDHVSLNVSGSAKARLAVIVDADKLSLQGANRLLKTLEEPPPRTRILLSSSRPKALPETVLSRCVRWRIAPPRAVESKPWLARRLKENGMELDDGALEAELKTSAMAPGGALQRALAGRRDALPPLFEGRGLGDALARAEHWARESGLSVGELLAAAEEQLNQAYAQSNAAFDLGAMRQIRTTLKEAKALVLGGNVPLGSQLVMESLAVAGARLALKEGTGRA